MRRMAGVTRYLFLCAVLMLLPAIVASQPPPPPPPLPPSPFPNLSCTELFGDAPEFLLCEETETTCSFNVLANGNTCEQICGGLGSTCAGAVDNEGLSCTETPGSSDTCQTPRETQICICERPEEPTIPPPPPEPQPTPLGWTTDQGITDNSGTITFVDEAIDGQVGVQVIDQAGNPVSNATVYFVADGSRARAFLIDPKYEPVWEEFEYPSSQQTQTKAVSVGFVILGAITLTLVAPDVYEFAINPPRMDLELGYVRSCLTYDQFINTVSLGVSVFGLYTLPKTITWAIFKKEGRKEVVAQSAEHILSAVGREWPWVGTWCFRGRFKIIESIVSITYESC